MSTSESDTSAIDEKKNENNQNESVTKSVGRFFLTLIVVLIILFTHFSLGGCILYWSKLGQSNILPTEESCYPYTENPIDIKPVTSNIFTKGDQSMKIEFPYNANNKKNTVLDILRKYMENPSTSVIGNYFASIIEKLICLNYSSLNNFFNFMNNAPEMLTVLIGPIIASFVLTLLFLFNILYFIYLWFSQMTWFFKEKTSSTAEIADWSTVTIASPMDYSLGFLLCFAFSLLFLVVLFFALPALPFVAISWSVLSLFGYKAMMYNKTTEITDIVKMVLKDYKITISTIFSLFVIMSTFANFGTIPGGISLLFVVLIYGGVVSMDLFKEEELSPDFSPLVNNDQAKKVCKLVKKREHGLLYKLLLGQKGGGETHLLNDLKKISKQMQSNML